MEIFQGKLPDPRFQEWMNRLGGKKIVVVATDDISCHEARNLIKTSSSNRHQPWTSDALKKAVFHLIICDSRGCKQILQSIDIKVP